MKLNLSVIAILYVLTLVVSLPADVSAHGEATPGPHGGTIRMPGLLHTEVIPVDANKFQIYLLDIGFNDPIVADSKVDARVEVGGKSVELDCTPKADFFLCEGPENAKFTEGIFILLANRKGVQGAEAIYQLPLSGH